MCPRPLVAAYMPPAVHRRSSLFSSYPVCLSCPEEFSGSEVAGNGFHASGSKPAVWNASYKSRISKHNSEFVDYSLAATQGAFGRSCDSDDALSRRQFLQSIIQGRMKNIDQDGGASSVGGGGQINGGGGKGTGGGDSGNDGFGFGGLGGEDGFFMAGAGSLVLLAAGIGLLTSVVARIFRGSGNPSRRDNKGNRGSSGATSSSSNETGGPKSWIHQGGSLSQASCRGAAFRSYTASPKGNPTPEPATPLYRYTTMWCKAADTAKVHFRSLFTGTMYPPPQIYAGAFYRQFVGLVGPEPGDWVETVDAEGKVHDKSLEQSMHCRNRSLDGVLVLNEKDQGQEEQRVQSPEEFEALMNKLHQVQQLLKKSELKRHEAIADLKANSSRYEDLEKSLRAKITSQESANKKIRSRLAELEEERVALVNVVDEASGALSGVFPDLAENAKNIDDLNKAVKENKTSLRLMENQLTVTSRERDAVLRRMEALQKDVTDIESLLDIVEKSRELVAASDSNDYSEKTLKANSCIQVLQQYLLKPTGSRHLSPIREVGNRVVIVFEKLMIELKRGFTQASKYIKQLEDLKTKLSQNSQDEDILASQLTELKEQYEKLSEVKANIEKSLETTQNTLAEAQENLDGTSRQETELRGALETLTCEKDSLSAMMHSIQREVADIESLTQIMEKTRELILNTDPNDMGTEQITLLDNCMTVLQQHHLRPRDPYDHVSRNNSDRLVRVFENLLSQTKQSIGKATESKNALKRVEEDLEGALSDESSLSVTIEGLRAQLSDMTSIKHSLSNDVQMLKLELKEKSDSLDQSRMELNELDKAKEEQSKDIEQLRDELDEKKKLLDVSRQTEEELTTSLQNISDERDLLQSKLTMNEDDLSDLKASLESVLADRKNAQEQVDVLQSEKNNLETQLAGLTHRIKDFESENSRLNAVAQTLRSNLDHERREKEQLEQEAEDLTAARSELHEKYIGEIENLKDRLENAQGDYKKLEEACQTLEDTNVELETRLEETSNKYNEQMEQLKKQHKGEADVSGSVDSEPAQPMYEESPFATQDREGVRAGNPAGEGSPQEGSDKGSDLTLPAEQIEAEYVKPEESKVLTWLAEAEVDPRSAVASEREGLATAPLLEQGSSQLLGNLMPASGAIHERKIHRRLSWPQDMTFALNDNLLGAAQELVEMTTATLELAAEKNEVESELNEVRQAINETRAQLEERENEVSDLTEHFLQVYQIASDLAADNEEQSSELRELRIASKRQQQDIELRDQRIAMLETEFAVHNMAPPRSTIPTTHCSDSLPDFANTAPIERAKPVFADSEYDDGNGRLRSASSLGFQSTGIKGLSSPRFEAPGTPSMASATLDIAKPRIQSNGTMTSASQNCEEQDCASVHYSYSDMSSLSGIEDDDCVAYYPDTNHYPARVDMN